MLSTDLAHLQYAKCIQRPKKAKREHHANLSDFEDVLVHVCGVILEMEFQWLWGSIL